MKFASTGFEVAADFVLTARLKAYARDLSSQYPGVRLSCLLWRVREIHLQGAGIEEAFQIAVAERADTNGGWA